MPDGQSSLPLAGVRVVDFSRLLPGPWCTQVLADLGADVIKVEQPVVGDYSRYNPPHYKTNSVYFDSVNRNKRSIVLDVGEAVDRDVALQLIDGAAILVESFRPGVAAKLGIDYATVAKRNPGLIYCSLNGFGAEGALAGMPGHDLSIQGLTGLLSKYEGVVPGMPGFQAGDYAAAAYAAIGVLAAYVRRQQSGQGCYLDVPMYDSLLCWSNIMLTGALARSAGFSGKPELEVWGNNPRYNVYPTRDGRAVTVSLLETRTWERFCQYIGRPDLMLAEDWSDRHSSHGERAPLFRQAIAEFCAARHRDPLVAEMLRAGISICPVYDADEAIASPEAKTRGLVRPQHYPADGEVPVLWDPLARAGLADPTRRPPPAMGEQGDEIRRELAAHEKKP
jgi:crotonobetainyl-CoA:carnitine CoA-transferase CaiB-like acyl-CoA transferase